MVLQMAEETAGLTAVSMDKMLENRRRYSLYKTIYRKRVTTIVVT